MHIMFEQGLQKLGSLSRRKFYSQEIDSYFNRSVNQFIKDSIEVDKDDNGFERTEIDLDRIRPLIVRDYKIKAKYIETLKNYREYQAQLPSDYSYLVSDTWYQAPVCTTNTTTSVVLYAYAVPIQDSPLSAVPYYAILKLQMTNGTLTETLVDLPVDTALGTTLYTGYNSKAEKFVIPKLIQEIFSQKSQNGDYSSLLSGVTGVYFERFGNLYYPGKLIVVTTSSTYYPKTVVDTATTSYSSGKNLSYTQDVGDEYDVDPSRLIRASKIDNILSTPYFKPLKNSPITSIDKGTIHVYSHTSRIVNKGSLTYIKQPQVINLVLQRNCDLAPEFHQKIIDMAVEYAAGRLEAEKLFQITAIENSKK